MRHRGPDEIQRHVLATYRSLRVGIIVVAAILPLLLWLGGAAWYGLAKQGSMSAYYHATTTAAFQRCEARCQEIAPQGADAVKADPELKQCRTEQKGAGRMRNWFVGLLWGTGIFLYLYKGFSTAEDLLLNGAGIAAVGVAMVPMDLWVISKSLTWHGASAGSLFIAIAAVAIFCARDTLGLITNPDERKRFERIYRGIGIAMIAVPAGTWLVTVKFDNRSDAVYWLEALSIWTFAVYWAVKSYEMLRKGTEQRALCGELESVDGKIREAVKK